MKKLIIVIAVFALSSCSHPSPKSERNPAQAFTLTEVSDALQPDLEKLEAILRPRVVRLDREMITFHYERADTSNYEPHSLQDVQRRMASGYLEKFFDVTDSGGYMEGPGEYVAVDAFSTRSYGGDQPQLYVIPIAKGTPILDTSTYYHDGEQPILEEMWGRLNCGKPDSANPQSTIPLSPRSMPEDFSNMIGDLRTSNEENCRRLVIRAVQDLGIEAILYDYQGATTLAECRHNRTQSINLIRHEAIAMSDMAYYDDHVKIEGRPMSGSIARLYKEGMSDPATRRDISMKYLAPPASLKNATTFFPFYRFWKRHKIFRCGSTWSLGGNDDMNRFLESLYTIYQDRTIVSELVPLFDAFKKRFGDSGGPHYVQLDLSRMNQIEKLSFEADSAAGPLTFEVWKAAQDTLVAGNGSWKDRAVIAARLLGETTPIEPKGFPLASALDYTKKIFKHAKTKAALMPISLFHLNYGPRLARITANTYIFNIGGVPFLTGGPLPHDLKKYTSDLIRANRQIYMDIIKTCTEQYSNSSISNDDIQKGPCGIRPQPK